MAEKREPARRFEDLVVWQKAHAWVLAIYAATRSFAKDEVYGLRSQLRRAAASVPANIAEGFPKRTRNDKRRFLNIAQGSLAEARYYLILTQELGYLEAYGLLEQTEEVSRLLNAADRGLGRQ